MDNIHNQPSAAPQELVSHPMKVALTQGDTNGVGLELIFKTFSDSAMFEICTPVVYGHAKVAAYHRRALGIELPFKMVASADEAEQGVLNFVNCSDEDVKIEFGKVAPEAGQAAFVALERAVQEAREGKVSALVTAPICKASIQSANFPYPGHTEYLQDSVPASDTTALMVLCNSMMRVALVTTHLPVSEVSFSVTQEVIEQHVHTLYHSLCRDFGLSAPRIAVLALNPHAGDSGLLGHEEMEVIQPAIKSLADAGLPVYGPFPADGFFGAAQYRQFDAVLAMYHDQGLAPFKALCMDDGVNFTAGVGIVRTSPDHGTAFDLAGRGQVRPDSFRSAIYAAIDIARHRQAYDESHQSPLPKLYHDRREERNGR